MQFKFNDSKLRDRFTLMKYILYPNKTRAVKTCRYPMYVGIDRVQLKTPIKNFKYIIVFIQFTV